MLTAKQPIVELRAFTDRNFALGSLFSFVLGIGLYGLTYLYPLFLGQVRGYAALMIGETVFVSGVAFPADAPSPILGPASLRREAARPPVPPS